MAQNRAIGKENKLPWHIPEELQIFKKKTMGYPMIMGRKTFESLPGILPGRRHIVLTRNPDFARKGAETANSWQQAFELCEKEGAAQKVFIIGGAEIFAEALNLADELHLTLLHREAEGDAFFPEFDNSFKEVKREDFTGKSENFTIVKFHRSSD